MPERPKVLVVYTGGTIGMRRTAVGYRPESGYLQALMAKIPAFEHPALPAFEIVEFDPLLDSADMHPQDWVRIAECIQTHYEDYDGFLVVHGTDTMAFSAAALSFMLEGLAKPVLITGSQIPLEEPRNDAQNNLFTALEILGRHHAGLSEVMVFFGSRLLRGNRCRKVSASSIDAFDSPNDPPLGRAAIDIELEWGRMLAPAPHTGRSGTLEVVHLGDATVGAFRLFPGIKPGVLAALLAEPTQGLVLECYGSGNAPTSDPAFVEVIKQATARGVVIVAVTQAPKGSANLAAYATGRRLLEAGVVSAFDLTAEAALAKLFYLFAKDHTSEQVKRLMATPLRGELTPRAPLREGSEDERLPWAAHDRAQLEGETQAEVPS